MDCARDLDAIAADYTDQSLFIINNRVLVGIDAIKNEFAKLFVIFSDGHNRIDPPQLINRIVFIPWHFAPAGDHEYYGTDTFVIEDGKIAVQTIGSALYDR